jgi:hypothetical protein
MGARTKEEEKQLLQRAEAQRLAAEEAARNTRRLNPNDVGDGDQRKINRWNRRMQRRLAGEDAEEQLRLLQEHQERIMQLSKDEGLLGGRGESARNPGGRNNTGIDWLKQNYNPDNNPFEGRDLQAEAAGAVANAKSEQQRRRHEDALGIAQGGTLSRDIGGATQTDFFGPDRGDQRAAYALGNATNPQFSVMNVPEQYGGGFAYGSPSVALPRADPSLMLATGGYNPQLGVGGSGVPMSAGEAAATDTLGNGIYGPRDASNPASQDASVARRNLAQGGMKQRMREFFENPFPAPEPTMENPAVSQTLPLLPVPQAAPPQAVPMQPQREVPMSYGEYTGGNFFGPPLVSPSEGPATNMLASMADQLVGGAAGLNDLVNYYVANPLMWAFTGNPEYYAPNATKAAAAKLFR